MNNKRAGYDGKSNIFASLEELPFNSSSTKYKFSKYTKMKIVANCVTSGQRGFMEKESENVQNHVKYSGDPKKTLRNPEFNEVGFRMVRLSNGRDHSNKTGLQPVSRPVE